MTYAELKRRLRRLGAEIDAQRTRHELWVYPPTQQRTLIPRHDQRDVSPGMLRAILQQLGVSRDAFDRG